MNYGFNVAIEENTVKEYTYDTKPDDKNKDSKKPLWLGLFVTGPENKTTAYNRMQDNCFNNYNFNIDTYCNRDVGTPFGKTALEYADMIFVSFDSTAEGKIAGPRAFMCVKKNHLSWGHRDHEDFYYIELICSAKTKRLPNKDSPPGKALLNALKTYVKDNNGNGIGLRAINTVINYYAKMDWKLNTGEKPCGKDIRVQHNYPLRSLFRLKWLEQNRLTKENNEKHNKEYIKLIKKLPTGSDLYINSQWEEFKRDCAPAQGVELEEECVDDFILYNSMSKAADGAPMIWCNPEYKPPAKKASEGGRKKRRRKKKRTKKRTKKKTKKKTKKYRTRKQLDGIWKRNTRKAKCSRLKKGSWAKKRKHCIKNDQCFWSGQRDICSSKKMY
jgi:hypothetical protein